MTDKQPIIKVANNGKQILKDIQGEDQHQRIKPIWQSKTFWVNIVALGALAVQQKWGYVIDESIQVQLLTVINIGIRMVTKDVVSWK